MPINVTFDAPPTPPSSGDKTNFRLRYDAFLAYIQSLGSKLITFKTEINDLETNVNAKEASATASAASAASSANFKGTFVQGTSSALQGESWLWNTVIYRALSNTTNSPTASPASWVATTYKECTLQTAIASAATTSIGTTAAGDTVHITGTTTITSFGTSTSANGLLRIVIFDGALTLTHNATSLILPTGANITTAAGDSAEFVCENTALGYWRCTGYQRANGRTISNQISGFKNYIINGNFDVWQYGTSQTTNGYGSDDRWQNNNIGSTKTHLQIACTDTERALFNASKFSRTVVTSVAGASNYVVKAQAIEDITKLAGKTVTISFWAKADSNKNIAITLQQFFGTGGSPSTIVNGIGAQLVALTTTWQKKTITLTLPSIIGKTIGTDGVNTSSTTLYFWLEAGSTIGTAYNISSLGQQSGTFDIAQVQIEEDSIATPFEQRPYGLELSLCQRYYEIIWHVFSNSPSTQFTNIYYKVVKRVSPTITSILDGGGGLPTYSISSGGIYQNGVAGGIGTAKLTLSSEL